jgi:hypothetical protein
MPIIFGICWEPIGNFYGSTLRTKKNQTPSPKEEYLWNTVVSDFTNFLNVHGNELSASATIQDMECSNLLVCVNEWLSEVI